MKVLDKFFEPYINKEIIEKQIQRIAADISLNHRHKDPLFIAVLNGSFMFASDILKNLSFPAQISFIKLASYSGLKSSGEISELIGLNENIDGRDIVILEDIVDSGLTMQKLCEYLKKKKASNVSVATLLFKPMSYKASIKIDYIGIEISDFFVIGYGMDYNGYGRNIGEIYKLKE